MRKVRSVVETQLLLQCGARPDIYSHYQCPLLSHLSLPLFTRNVERGPGGTELGPAQLSLKSLWPVTLANPTSPGCGTFLNAILWTLSLLCSPSLTRWGGCEVVCTVSGGPVFPLAGPAPPPSPPPPHTQSHTYAL